MTEWQNNFTGGECSPQARSRWDQAFHGAAADILENLFVMVEGGLTRVPGTRYVASSKTAGEDIRLLPYRKSNEDGVCIVAGPLYFRFYDGATTERLTGNVEKVTTYDAADLRWLWYWQSTDVMFFTLRDGSQKPHILIRYADDDWALNAYNFKNGPFQGPNSGNVTITPNTDTGAVTLTAAASIFDPDIVGGQFRLWTENYAVPFEKWEAGEDPVANGSKRVHEGRVFQAAVGTVASRSPPVHEEGTSSDGGTLLWTYLHDLAGVVSVSGYVSATQVTGTVKSRLPQTAGTTSWAEGYFSPLRGWPFVGINFGSRLFYAGSPSFPDTLWGSRIDGFNTLEVDFKQSEGGGEVNDDHAVVRTLNDSEANRISWLIGGDLLFGGQANGIVVITGPSADEPITPAGANAKKIKHAPGADFRCVGLEAKTDILYPSVGGRAFIALSTADLSHITLSARSRHVLASPFKNTCWLDAPYNRCIAVAEDGRCWCLTFDREQSIVAWTRLVPAGSYRGNYPLVRDVTSLPGEDGTDRLWWAVTRTVNGTDQTFIERMEPDFDGGRSLSDEAVFADAAVILNRWNADAAKTVTLTAAGGVDNAIAGATVTLTASGHTFGAGDVGKELRLRREHRPARPGDVNGETVIEITAQSAGTATGMLLTDAKAAHYGIALDQWGYATDTITGLSHLNGESVGVWGDGVDLGDFTVSGGSIDIGPDTVVRACVGLRKSYRGRSLDLIKRGRDGVSVGRAVNAHNVWVDLLWCALEEGSVRLVVNGVEQEGVPLRVRDDDDPITDSVDLKSGVFRLNPPGKSTKQVQTEIYGNGMGPMSLRAVGVEYD